MAKPILIDKNTLQEILEKYQGGGSAGGGKLYEYSFDLITYNLDGSQSSQTAKSFSFYIYESNFERFKAIATQLGITKNTPQDFRDYINNNFNETTGSLVDYTSVIILSTIANSVDFMIGFTPSPTKLSCNDLGFWTLPDMHMSSPNYQKLTGYDNEQDSDFALGLNVNNSCTLTEYGTSASGGTVEAEPIVSIKMTNVDACIDEQETLNTIVDFQLYCTKERWDNFVSLASSQFSVDITYSNFDSVFKQLNRTTQMFAIGYLMMDYYESKVLPITFVKGKTSLQDDYDAIYQLQYCSTFKDATLTNNIEIVLVGTYRDAQSESVTWAIPNDLTPVTQDHANFVTANTVITVEEIDGAAIDSSSGSGTSEDTLKNYKELLTFYDQNGDKICGISKILALKTKEWYYAALNTGIQSVASMLGLTIPTVTDDNTAQSGLNTILRTMQQAGISSNIPNLIINFVADYDFVIKESASNAGNENYPLFITGDISAYIMEAGSFTNLLTKFDFTGVYTVGYSLLEVNVTD